MALSHKNQDQCKSATDFLCSMIRLFETISIGNAGAWKPVQTGVILTTHSVLDVADDLLASSYNFLLTSHLTSDCIENLFSCVRTNNAVPTPLEFKNKLRISIAQFLKAKNNTSYSIDDGKYLADFLWKSRTNIEERETDDDIPDISLSNMPFLSSADVASLFYMAEYIISCVIRSNVTCDNCCKAVKSSNEELASNASYMALLKLKS